MNDHEITQLQANVAVGDHDDTVVLLEFFRQATQALNDCQTTLWLGQEKPYDGEKDPDSSSSWMSFSEIRTILLSQQTKCLSSSIDTCLQNHSISSSVEYTVARLQVALQSLNTSTSTSASTSHAINISPSFIQQQQAMEEMNDTARTTFCYFVIWSELHYDEVCQNQSALTNSPSSSSSPRTLISSSSSNTTGSNNNNNNNNNCMKSSDVLEFCGLCRTAVRISDVMRYLQHGTPIFPNIQMLQLSSSSLPLPSSSSSSSPPPECTFQFPQQRLQYLQRLFLRAMGYDPDYGTQLIQEMFYNNKQHDESSMEHIDANVLSVFRNMEQLMEQTLNDITNKLTLETFHGTNQTNDISNDTNTDGVTRIVGVTYSEKYIDAETGQDIMTIHPNDHTGGENHAPQSLTMNYNDDDTFLTTSATAAPNTNDNDSATHPTNTSNRSTDETWQRQAAELEQEILGELLSMREEERDMKLQMIHRVVQTVMDHARSLPEQQDRISYLTQLDYTTQRCLCMKKIWDTMLEQNDQQVPRTMY